MKKSSGQKKRRMSISLLGHRTTKSADKLDLRFLFVFVFCSFSVRNWKEMFVNADVIESAQALPS